MERWQQLMPSAQLRMLLELATLLFFPRQQFFTSTRSGLLTIFIPGESFVDDSKVFPSDWRDLYSAHWDFAKGERHATNLSDLANIAAVPNSLQPILANISYQTSDIEALIRWLVERYNQFAFHQTDAAEFIDNDLVDFVTCFEQALTLDRALRKGMSSVLSTASITRKSTEACRA